MGDKDIWGPQYHEAAGLVLSLGQRCDHVQP